MYMDIPQQQKEEIFFEQLERNIKEFGHLYDVYLDNKSKHETVKDMQTLFENMFLAQDYVNTSTLAYLKECNKRKDYPRDYL